MDEEGDMQHPPPVSTVSNSTADNTDCTPNSRQQQQIPSETDVNNSSNAYSLEERLAILQELYQRRHAELLAQFQQTQNLAEQDYLLNLQLLQSALPAAAAVVVLQQQQFAAPTPGSAQNPSLLGALRQNSSEQSADEFDSNLATAAISVHQAQQQPQKQTSNSESLTSTAFNVNANKEQNIAPTTRNRRTFSGSGQTISQHTRDRIKSMIAIKKQKQRLHSSSSAGSTSNIANAATSINNTTSKWFQNNIPAGNANSELNLMSGIGSAVDSIDPSSSMPVSLVNTHIDQRFLPYPHPIHCPTTRANIDSSTINVDSTVNLSATEFQLRKVNSEPNLKMRIRARLLNKGSSPQQQQANANSNVPVTTASSVFQQLPIMSNILQRPDSGGTLASTNVLDQKQQQQNLAVNADTALLFQQAVQHKLGNQHLSANTAVVSAANLMVPSPSLPNLPTTIGATTLGDGLTGGSSALGQQDMLNLVSLQNTFMHFLSMPSLLKSPLLQTNFLFETPQSLADSASSTSNSGFSMPIQRTVRFDNRNAPMSLGYPSLLKQQLRDLVLRRKSLVREETEDDTMMEFANAARGQSNAGGAETGNQLKTGLAYDQSMVKHQCLCGDNNNHVEHGGRIQSIWTKLVESGLVSQCERIVARKATLEVLRLVHSPTYVTFFAVSPTACLKMDPTELPLKSFVQLPCGGIGVDSDTYFNDANTQTAAKMAVGSLVELCCQVMEGKLRNGFACIRPPGHHSEREQAMGFCFFNNVAITARYLQQRFGVVCSRIAIIDWDVHHGNGTQLCFESDPNCLYLSLHRHDNGNFFPGTGAVTEVGVGEGKGTTINIPFSGAIMGDAEYLAAWRVIVLPLLDAYKPDFILVSAGFDGTQGHPAALGGYNLSPKLFGYLTHTLMQFANGKVVLALEGGYELTAISNSVEECVKVLCSKNGGDVTQLSHETLEQIPNLSAQETIQKVIAVHKKHWPCLTGVQGINTSELHWQTINHRFSTLTVHS